MLLNAAELKIALKVIVAAAVFVLGTAAVSSAHEHFFSATLNGANQSPANGSLGTAAVDVTRDLDILDF